MTTQIMAAVNASPESFYGGSVKSTADELAEAARRAEDDGAAMIDIGAMSTAPYKDTIISLEEETRRMAAAVRAVRAACSLPISADTQRAPVAHAALEEGAAVVNDVSALQGDPEMASLIAGRGVVVVLMANELGEIDERNESAIDVVKRLLEESVTRALSAGIAREKIILDPGIGFFRKRSLKWDEWDWTVLRDVAQLKALGFPILVGASRKSFLGKISGRGNAGDRLAASLAVAAWCAQAGVDWIRTHDVSETRDVISTIDKLNQRF